MGAGRFLAITSSDESSACGGQRPLGIGIALGSNLGDRLANLRRARALIRALPEALPGQCDSAPVFETAPVGCEPGAPPFLNTVIEVWPRSSAVSPERLLALLRAIETALGRAPTQARNRSRVIDLDLLFVGNQRARSETLTLPHPRLSQRRFVLAPLAALRPACVLPDQRASVSELLAALTVDPAAMRKFAEVW